jgi:prepilin-type processing-associated H-X9-DG protein
LRGGKKFSQFENTTQVAILFDAGSDWLFNVKNWESSIAPGNPPTYEGMYIHSGGANYLFLDGHVAWYLFSTAQGINNQELNIRW